jgi:cytochrome c-type biogenesis protein CcmH
VTSLPLKLVLSLSVWLAWLGLAAAEPLHGTASFDKFVPGAAELEGRIIAPCCWTQTIDIHGSEISTALRLEIRSRLEKGESAAAIERSIVERYGERVLAVPPGSRLGSAGVLLILGMVGAGVFAFTRLRRWQQRGQDHAGADAKAKAQPSAAQGANDAALDARIDAELARLDGD